MKTIFQFLSLMVCCLLLTCSATIQKPAKINGVSFVASRDTISALHITPVKKLNANYAAVMPFGFVRDLAHPEISYNSNRQWFGETVEGVKQYVEELHKNQIKVMLKPQIWVRGAFTGFIKMAHDDDWNVFENSYSEFILAYAKVAQDMNVDIFCMGTELESFIDERPEYWKSLIVEIRKIYKGKLTYAANWNEYDRTPFWNELDYIGVDAYFPLSASKTPTVEECKKGWIPYKEHLKRVSEVHNKPILFTEYGYRSVDFAAKEPWKADRDMIDINFEAQSNAMRSLFEEVWSKDWFAGGFVWKWFHAHEKVGGKEDSQFTPQNKPVEHIIREFYNSY